MIESRSGPRATPAPTQMEESWFADAKPFDATSTESMMQWRELLNLHAAAVTLDPDQVKSALSKGVPTEMRREVWLTFSGVAALMQQQPHVFQQLCERVTTAEQRRADAAADAAAAAAAAAATAAAAAPSGSPHSSTHTYPSVAAASSPYAPPQALLAGLQLSVLEQVEKDLRRTEAGTEGEKLNSMRRVLCAFAAFNPDVGYVQGMNFIAAALLALLSEEESFWMLTLIVQARARVKGGDGGGEGRRGGGGFQEGGEWEGGSCCCSGCRGWREAGGLLGGVEADGPRTSGIVREESWLACRRCVPDPPMDPYPDPCRRSGYPTTTHERWWATTSTAASSSG